MEVKIIVAKNINIICGENSTGKTTLLKVMYSLLKPMSIEKRGVTTKDIEEKQVVEKLQGVFRPDGMKVGRLVRRKQGSSRTEFAMVFDNKQKISVGFGNRQENHVDIKSEHMSPFEKFDAIYIPTKEMISTTEHFVSLYDEYHIDFEEMYYDLAKLLDRPLSKGPNTNEQNEILKSIEEIMKGQIIQRDKKFYLKSGSLNKNAVLFWDEPETNMNPGMIHPIVQAMVQLAKMGVQIFVTTHDYFVQQEFNMLTVYPELNLDGLDIRFMSLYRDSESNAVMYEMKETASGLKNNAIMREFDAIYDREQGIIYGS